MKCIICKKDKNKLSQEHIFPESIGGSLIINSVCKSCNDKLGRNVDSHLVNHKLIEFARSDLGIVGKKGKIPNPLKKGILSNEPNQKVHIDLIDSNTSKLYCVPNINKNKREDGSKEINIKVDKTDKNKIPNIVNKILKRNNIPEKSKEEIEKTLHKETNKNPKIELNISIDIVEYQRAIVKIAYELGYYILGNDYLKDETGEMLRNFFLDNNLKVDFSEKYPIRGKIHFISGSSTMIPIRKEHKNYHIASLLKIDNSIGCYIKIFNTFEGMIVISNKSSTYSNFESKFIAINPQNGKIIESTIIEEILNSCK